MAFKFAKKGGAGEAAAKKKKKSRYAGVESYGARDPIPVPGGYRFKFLGAEETRNPGKGTEWFRATLEIVDRMGPEAEKKHRVGEKVVYLQNIDTDAGCSKVKGFVMALIGVEDNETYDEFDPDGEFIDAIAGAENDRSEEAKECIGNLVLAEVRNENPVIDKKTKEPTGDYYRGWQFTSDEE